MWGGGGGEIDTDSRAGAGPSGAMPSADPSGSKGGVGRPSPGQGGGRASAAGALRTLGKSGSEESWDMAMRPLAGVRVWLGRRPGVEETAAVVGRRESESAGPEARRRKEQPQSWASVSPSRLGRRPGVE